jgi:fatty acid-binding protein DegV
MVQGQTKIEVIDSQTIATGLGLIVQNAAEASEAEMGLEEVKALTRNLLPRVYSVFIINGLTYLEKIDVVEHPQAVIAEKFKMLPMFMLDNDVFFSSYKARNKRHIVELFHEFLFEFPKIDHIAFTQGFPPFENETRALRERITEDFPITQVSEHIINVPMTAIMGPSTLGMFVLQKEE